MTARERTVHVLPGGPGPLPMMRQDVAETLDYAFDWSHALETGETITSSSWTSSPEGLDLEADELGEDPTSITRAVLSAGAVGTWYRVSNTITTSADRTFQRSFRIDVVNR